ncbi:MAG: ABC transporter ATP-binding protein [Clostridia bacterium]|nr:ABC transporter ATP-binding protein [Clostridia bacterium]
MSYDNEAEFDREEKMDAKLWKRLFGYAIRNRALFIRILLSMLIVAGIDALYPILTRFAIDRFVRPDATPTTDGLWTFFGIYVALVVFQGFFTMRFIGRSGEMEMAISYAIRQEAYLKLQTLSFSFYDKTSAGYLMARMVSDVARLSDMIAWSITDFLWSGFYITFCFAAMFWFNWKLALIVLAVIPPLAIVSLYIQRRILRYQRIARKHNSRITGAFNEGIMGAMTTKTLVREEQNAAEFETITTDMRKASVKASVLSASFFPLVVSLGAVGTSLALIFGGAGVEASLGGAETFLGVITAGTLVSFINYASSLFDPIQQLAGIFADMQSAQASAERVLSLLDTESEVSDTPEAEAKYGTSMDPKRENWESIEGDIIFDHVDFYYKESEPLLRDFNLHIRAGETIALVGETGAGKSTIVNLICRFYEPKKGRILIDGRDYRERSQLWLQSSLGYVLQSPHLFSGTIRDNIRFGRPDADEESVRRAAAMVHADAFIERQQKGYDTEVGEGGVRLSTGQKQLISFARVILADPQIFVLDEATSSIDTETEQLIQSAITEVLKGRTSIVVAHRLSTIRNADRILVIRGGAIVEEGNHETLLEKGGYYHDLYMHQYEEDAMQEALK